MPSPNLHLTFRDGGTGDAGDPYTGLDRFGRLVETLWKTGSTDQVRTKYGRNRFGGVVWRRDEEAHAQDVSTEDNYYGYDALQQVKQRQRGDLTGPAPDYTGITNLQQEAGWTHDATGNWAAYSNTSPTNGQTRTHNTANEITEISSSPGDVEPAYDPAGNMLTLPKEPGGSTEQYDLVWDAWNRLVAVKDGGAVVASYTYDGLTRRQTKTNAAGTRHYYYDRQWRSVEERLNDGGTIDRQYIWGLRDRWDLLRRKRSVGGSLDETLFLLRDYLDPVAIVDESGAVVERYAYDAFGNVRFLAPDFTSKSDSDFDWEFLFHAEFRDKDTKLYNYGYRYYDAALGRWLSRDPLRERSGVDLYKFSHNDGIGNFDMLGLEVDYYNGEYRTIINNDEAFWAKILNDRNRRYTGLTTDNWEIHVAISSDGLEPGKKHCIAVWGKLDVDVYYSPDRIEWWNKIVLGPLNKPLNNMKLTLAHESGHVQILSDAWNCMASVLNDSDGMCFCCLEMANHEKRLLELFAETQKWWAVYQNHLYDQAEYGGGAPDAALSIYQSAERDLAKERSKIPKCNK